MVITEAGITAQKRIQDHTFTADDVQIVVRAGISKKMYFKILRRRKRSD